jgi:Tfp pilus assembly PilM family ATPase
VFSQGRLTLSIEANEVRLLVAQGQRVVRWESLSLPPGVMRDGQVVQPAAFGEAVAGLLARTNAPRRRAVVSLGGQRALVRILNLPTVPARMLDEAVQRAARRELPLPPEELYLSWQVLGDYKASRLRVFTLGVPREAVDNCIAGLRSAGVRPQALDLKPLALARAVNLPDVLLANLEEETESVVLVRGFVPCIVRSVAAPGETARSSEERAEHLATEIQRTLDFYGSTMTADYPAWAPAVCLTGALGADKEIRAQIGARWPLVEPALPIPLPAELPLLAYLVNVGLVLKHAP